MLSALNCGYSPLHEAELDSTIVNSAVPSMAAVLHVTPLSLKGVVASYILSLAMAPSSSGRR